MHCFFLLLFFFFFPQSHVCLFGQTAVFVCISNPDTTITADVDVVTQAISACASFTTTFPCSLCLSYALSTSSIQGERDSLLTHAFLIHLSPVSLCLSNKVFILPTLDLNHNKEETCFVEAKYICYRLIFLIFLS